ncbi:MAG: DUF3089 domain-containing protein [Prevotella sp.]|nr:DUF3089 domain-containing protein [Prevotella sp.]
MKTTIDYSQKENWCKFPEITKDVDTFYIFATEYILGSFEEGAPDYGSLDNEEMIQGMGVEYIGHATTYADDTNVFAPYYRQSGLKYAGKIVERDGNLDAALLGMPYNDIVDALDYYFEHYNEGRPFIIAGHSQGSALVKQVLFRYFKEHPDYYQRMVAAYVIGYAVTKEELETYPYLKFATGESDAGVIVSWNTEGPKNAEVDAKTVVLMPGGISINPLNWKLDETYAPASLNLGSLIVNEQTGEPEIADIGADAQVNLARGSVITNAKAAPMPEDTAKIAAAYFGPDGRHGEDYTFYYNNIKANVAKRIATYKASL